MFITLLGCIAFHMKSVLDMIAQITQIYVFLFARHIILHGLQMHLVYFAQHFQPSLNRPGGISVLPLLEVP